MVGKSENLRQIAGLYGVVAALHLCGGGLLLYYGLPHPALIGLGFAAYMLGLRQLVVVAHGRFTRRGFARAIEVAARGVEQDVIRSTRAALEAAGALRPPIEDDEEGDGGASSETTATVSSR